MAKYIITNQEETKFYNNGSSLGRTHFLTTKKSRATIFKNRNKAKNALERIFGMGKLKMVELNEEMDIKKEVVDLKEEEFNIIDVAKSYDNSCETEYLEKKENLKLRIAINNSLKRFTPLQKKIWDSRAQEESEYNFVKTNKVSKKEYESNLEAMKKIYDFELRKLND